MSPLLPFAPTTGRAATVGGAARVLRWRESDDKSSHSKATTSRTLECGDLSPLLPFVPRPSSCHRRRRCSSPAVARKRRQVVALQTRRQVALWSAVTCHRFSPFVPRPLCCHRRRCARVLRWRESDDKSSHSKTRKRRQVALWSAVTCHRFCLLLPRPLRCHRRRRCSSPVVARKRRQVVALQNAKATTSRTLECGDLSPLFAFRPTTVRCHRSRRCSSPAVARKRRQVVALQNAKRRVAFGVR